MAIFAIFAFSLSPPIAKAVITQGMDPTALLALRFFVAALLLVSTIGVIAPNRLRIDRSGFLRCVGAGLALGSMTLAFYWSFTRIEASVASMILALYPLVVLGLLALRGEKFTYINTIRLALGLGGVYLLIGPGGQVDLLGTLLVLCACCAFGLYLVILQWFLQDYDTQTVAMYVVATMSVLTAGLWLVQGAEWYVPGWQSWLAIGVLVVINTYLAQQALFAAVRSIGSGQMALLGPLETLLTVLWSFIFLHERLSVLQWIGGSLILSSMLLAVQRPCRKSKI
jgi:drug/metabolite transporter (DMT)-like permease